MSFSDNLNAYILNPQNRHSPIDVCETPNALLTIGAKPLPVVMNPNDIDKCLAGQTANKNKNSHDLTTKELGTLPELLENPAMVLKDPKTNNITVVTDMFDKIGNPFVIGVELNRAQDEYFVNRVATMHGRERAFESFIAKNGKKVQGFVPRMITEGNLLAINIEKAPNFLRPTGLQLPEGEEFVSFDNSIAYSLKSVKGLSQEILKNQGGIDLKKSDQQQTQTIVINMFAGPGAGKSTSSWEIAAEFKLKGLNAEYVPEYAKELVYDENWELLNGSLENQKTIFDEQCRRMDRLIGKVDVIVTDAPLLLNNIYLKDGGIDSDNHKKYVVDKFKSYDNINIFIERTKAAYETRGRTQSLEESKSLDGNIRDILNENNIRFDTFSKLNIRTAVPLIIEKFNGLNLFTEERIMADNQEKSLYETLLKNPYAIKGADLSGCTNNELNKLLEAINKEADAKGIEADNGTNYESYNSLLSLDDLQDCRDLVYSELNNKSPYEIPYADISTLSNNELNSLREAINKFDTFSKLNIRNAVPLIIEKFNKLNVFMEERIMAENQGKSLHETLSRNLYAIREADLSQLSNAQLSNLLVRLDKEMELVNEDINADVADNYSALIGNLEELDECRMTVCEAQGNKSPRLFVDMDGTLARFHDEANYLERMFEENFFKDLEPFQEAVDGVNQFIKDNPNTEVFILSGAVDGEPPYCRVEKQEWLTRHLPDIDVEHMIFTKIGEPKSGYVSGGIGRNDFLYDDYNVSLEQWERDGGVGIKCRNNINHKGLNGKLWDGLILSNSESSKEIAQGLGEIMYKVGLEHKLNPPEENMMYMKETEFLPD
ncbi:MAG: AAA family ATPase [Oscillospiraceae bacterium]|nr:AAA family ATPase [Oscillospiraceae bacterium]